MTRRSESDVQALRSGAREASRRGENVRRSENDMQALRSGVRESSRHWSESGVPTPPAHAGSALPRAPSVPAPGPPVKRMHPDDHGPLRTPVKSLLRTPVSVQEKTGKPKRQNNETRRSSFRLTRLRVSVTGGEVG